MRRRMMAILLPLMVVAGIMSAMTVTAWASDSNVVSTDLAKPFSQLNVSQDPFGYTDQTMEAAAAESRYPEKFDLRNVDGKSYVTPVKFQNPFGTCWGFAATTAAETSILGNPSIVGDMTADTLDLSEKHLAFFAAKALDDPTSSQNGEGTHTHGATAAERMDNGGLPFMATSLYSSGTGPVLESRDEILVYKGRQGLIEKQKVDGKWSDYSYSKNDDWEIDESWRFRQSYVLKESYCLPTPAITDSDAQKEEDRYKYNPAGTAAIKEQLMNKRGVEIGYYCSYHPGKTDKTGAANFLSENYAHYTYVNVQANHAVCIVGWDDNYPKENFNQGTYEDDAGFLHNMAPPENGAWLVKNSWGSGEEAFPNHGSGDWGYVDPATGKHTGYFWLSYYDYNISTPEALAFDKSNVGSSYILDQLDYMPVNDVFGATASKELVMANVLQAEMCEKVEQISCQTSHPGTSVHYEIYVLPDEFVSPEQGKLVASGDAGPFEFGGYHKIDLNTDVYIQKGQKFAILETQKTADNNYAVNIPIAYGKEPASNVKDEYWEVGIINNNESFLRMGGKWYDCAGMKKQLIKKVDNENVEDADSFSVDNFPIKAYSTQIPDLNIIVDADPYLDDVDKIESFVSEMVGMDLDVRFRGEAGVEPADNAEVKMEIVPKDTDGVSLKPDDEGVMELEVSKCADCDLYISVDGVGTKIIPLIFRPSVFPIRSVKTGKNRMTVKAEDQKALGITGYQLRYRANGTKKWKTKNFGPDKPVFTIKGLKKGKRYQVGIRSCYQSPKGRILYSEWSETETSGKVK